MKDVTTSLKPIEVRGPYNKAQNVLFLSTLALALLDAVTTLTFFTTDKATELNPILRSLMENNPLLAIPYLVSLILPVFLFSFTPLVQLSIQIALATNFFLASLNNICIITYSDPIVINLFRASFGEWFSVEFLAFAVGLVVLCALRITTFDRSKQKLRQMALQSVSSITLYVCCYLIISLIPVLWNSL